MDFLKDYWWLVPIVLIVSSGLFTINQGTIGVITRLGKYAGVKRAGLKLEDPFY